MKEPTTDNTPSDVLTVKFAQAFGIPLGSKTIENALECYPEYFPLEIEHRQKWAAIPKTVHDSYRKELLELDEKIMYGVESKGMFGWVKNPDAYLAYKEHYDSGKKLRDDLYKKYYSSYGF